MLETIGPAKKSRRQVLRWLGGAALAAAIAAGGILTLPDVAKAEKPAPAVCGPNSDIYCRGGYEGNSCGGGYGQCKGAPDCFCWVKPGNGRGR